MTPKLSVVICTFNRGESLKQCLQSLAKQTFTNFEVVIIGQAEEFSGKLKIRKVADPKSGLAVARDLGWRKAKAELVAWIDDDVVVTKNWAKSIVSIFDKHKNVAGVSGPTIVPGKFLNQRDAFFWYKPKGLLKIIAPIWIKFFLEDKPEAVGKIFKSGAWSPGSNFSSSLKIKGLIDVDYLEACNIALRRNLVEKVGGFNLDYQGTAEWCELDLAMRIKERGYRLVFSSQVKVEHHLSQKGAFLRRTAAKQRMENFLKFYFRHVFKFRLDYLFKFLSYLLFLNFYWTYKTITTKSLNWLNGWLGSVSGLKYAFNLGRHS